MSEPVDAEKFDLESFLGRNGTGDHILDVFSINQVDDCACLKRSLSHMRCLLLRFKHRRDKSSGALRSSQWLAVRPTLSVRRMEGRVK